MSAGGRGVSGFRFDRLPPLIGSADFAAFTPKCPWHRRFYVSHFKTKLSAIPTLLTDGDFEWNPTRTTSSLRPVRS